MSASLKFHVSLFDIEQMIADAGICAYLDVDGAAFEFIDCPFIGDRVFEDLNVNGVQDEGEPGLAGVRVNLRRTTDNSLVLTDVSSGSGRYGFYVMAGDYYLEFETPTGYNITPMQWGTDPKIDSDIDPVTGRTVPLSFSDASASTGDLDAGYFDASICFAHCELRLDQNPDIYLCQMTSPSVTVSASPLGTPFIPDGYQVLYVLTEGDGLLIEKASSESSFSVPKPEPGICRMHCVIYDPDKYNDQSLINNIRFRASTLFELADDISAQDDCAFIDMQGVAFEFIDCPLIGNQVFVDVNGNGIRDDNEAGIPGVQVDLLAADDLSVVTSLSTNSRGQFYFYTMSGEYYLQFTTPAGYEITLPGQGTDVTLDSDIDPITGRSPLISLPQGSYVNLDIDAGYVPLQSLQTALGKESGRGVDRQGGLIGRVDSQKLKSPQVQPGLQLSSYPNPFADHAYIVFNLTDTGTVSLILRDNHGRVIRRLERQYYAPGRHQWRLETDDLPAGLFHYTLIAENLQKTKTMVKVFTP